MPTGFVIWDAERKSLAPGGVYKTSEDATAAILSVIAKAGATPEKQTYSVISVPVNTL